MPAQEEPKEEPMETDAAAAPQTPEVEMVD